MQYGAFLQRNRLDFFLGLFCLLYWIFDFYNIVFLIQKPSWLLWYSSAGLLFTSIALLTRNIPLLYSSFCALFLIELFWSIELILMWVLGIPLFGFTHYVFDANFSTKDFFMTFYHPFIPLSLFLAVMKEKTTNNYGWLGAALFATTIALLTILFVPQSENVNCLSSLNQCGTVFAFLYFTDTPYRIGIGLLLLLSFIFIPSNYFLLKYKSRP